MVVELSGVDAPVANTLRRILLSEVPTMAIEVVRIYDNTSVIQDEVLAHRLGLIPIKADPAHFQPYVKPEAGEEEQFLESNSLIFDLNVVCSRDEAGNLQHSKVMSSDLVWMPWGGQRDRLAGENRPRVVHDDILIAKLGEGQAIHIKCFVTKGVGKVHAKWSPVATASYRLLPEPVVTYQPPKAEAQRIASLCPTNVFDIEDSGALLVSRPRNCTMCRECIRPAPDAPADAQGPAIRLQRVKDHFIFSVESTGILKPARLFADSIKLLRERAQHYLACFDDGTDDIGIAALGGSESDDDDGNEDDVPGMEIE